MQTIGQPIGETTLDLVKERPQIRVGVAGSLLENSSGHVLADTIFGADRLVLVARDRLPDPFGLAILHTRQASKLVESTLAHVPTGV